MTKESGGKVVYKFQNAFVKGKQILNAALVANEAIDTTLKSNFTEVICKLYIEKAYNYVN